MQKGNLLLFKTIFEQSPISTQVFDPSGQTLMVNQAWEELWNVQAKFVINSYNILKDKQLIETGSMPYINRGFKGEVVTIPAIKYDPSRTIDIKGVVPYRWLQAQMYPIKDENETITHIVLQHEDITERKEAEDQKQKFVSLVNTSTDFICIANANQKVVFVNHAGLQMAGLKNLQQAQKTKVIDYFLQRDQERIKKQIQPELFKKNHWIGELQFKSFKTGKLIPVLWNIFTIRDEKTGEIINYAYVARDISERKQSEEANYKLASLVESSADAIISKTLDGYITSWNKSAERLFGYQAQEAIDKHITLIVPPELRKEEEQLISKIRKGQKIPPFETVRTTKDGKRLTISLTISPIIDNQGTIIGASKIARDITEQKKSEKALQESEERLRIALTAGKIGVWDWDIKTNELTWTDTVYTIHGVRKGKFKVTVDNFKKLIHPEDIDVFQLAIENSLKNKAPFEIDFRIITANGKVRWVTTSASTSYNSKGEPLRMLGATSDITQQKQLDQDKSDFLSMASHELKTPLTSMKMFIELLSRQVGNSESDKVSYYSKRINDQASRLIELTNDLLDVSRIETGKLNLNIEKFSLDHLITDTVEGIQHSTDQHHISFICKSRLTIMGDRFRLYQVLINLLTNAIKYSPNSKKVIITLAKTKQEALVSVQDFGIGIKKSQLKKIFDRLYQVTDPEQKTFPGLGLGLYITNEIIQRHNGKIWVESQVGKGSTFYFSLPLDQSRVSE